MKKRDDLNIFYDLVFDSLNDIENDSKFPEVFYNTFLAGANTIYQKRITETKRFDDDWIDTLESYFPSLDKILKNPKSTLKYEEEIIAIEKAKKTNSSSIRHLASHTHLIKEIKKDSIIPKKILTQNAETEFEIYENRFIKTLIDRLYTFVNRRVEIIRSNIESFQKQHLNFTSKFNFDNSEVDLNIDLSVKKDLDDQTINQHNQELLKRVEYLAVLIGGFKTSLFMKTMEKAKPVVPPIMKTNIILKNSDFKNAYTLWLYLDRYTSLGYDVDVQELNIDVNKSFLKDIYQLSLLTYATIQFNQREKNEKFENNDLVEYKRRGTRVAKTNAKDIVQNPDAITVEDNKINEYYLDQNKKVFRKKIDELVSQNISYEMALKKAMRETIEITNALYQSVFGLENEEEEDVFAKMVKKVDLDSDLDEAKTKAKIARLIRETKEVDYNNSVRMEKRLLKQIESVNNQIIKREKARIKEEIEEAKRIQLEQKLMQIKQLKEKAKKNQEILDKSVEDISKLKEEIIQEQSTVTKKLKESTANLQTKKKEMIAKEKEKIKIQKQKEIQKLKDKEKKAKEKEKARLAALKAKEKEKALNDKAKTATRKRKPNLLLEPIEELTEAQQINAKVDELLKKAKTESVEETLEVSGMEKNN